MEEKNDCKYCGKVLIPFTGKNKEDWITRKYHRSCWTKKFNEFAYQEMQNQYRESSN